jgi:hypothetical protein
MQNHDRDFVNGCVMWISILVLCAGVPVLSVIIENTTGFHLRNVQTFQPFLALAVAATWLGGSALIVMKIMDRLEGSSHSGRKGEDSADSLDRGAGTMSWHDTGDGSE